MGIYRDNIQKNIIRKRNELNLTQKELADKLGLKLTTISSWERGVSSPDIETLIMLCDIFNMSLSEMYGVERGNLSHEEIMLIDKYRKLDKVGQDIINYIIEAELSRFSNDEYITTVAARGNSEQKVKLNKKALKEALEKPMSTEYDD